MESCFPYEDDSVIKGKMGRKQSLVGEQPVDFSSAGREGTGGQRAREMGRAGKIDQDQMRGLLFCR